MLSIGLEFNLARVRRREEKNLIDTCRFEELLRFNHILRFYALLAAIVKYVVSSVVCTYASYD